MSELYTGLDTGSKTCYWWGTDSEGTLIDEGRVPTKDDSLTDLFKDL